MNDEVYIYIIIAVSVAVICALLFLVIPYITYRMTFRRKVDDYDVYMGLDSPSFNGHSEEARSLIDRMLGEPYELLEMKSRDGLTLKARYYHVKDGAPLQIQCHGYKSTPVRDFSGGAGEAIDRGHNLLLIYQRSHGLSEGKTIAFGALEKYDVLDWIDLMLKKLGEKTEIILVGISMGAATAILTAALDIPKNVKCVIADCPYSSAKGIIKKVAAEMGYPSDIVYPFIKLGAKLYGKFDIDEADAVKAIKNASLPILLIHGEADSFVPREMSTELKRAAGDRCRFESFPEASHGLSYIMDPVRDRKSVV